MPTLDTLQLPRIDTSAYGGREAKKIAGHLYQVEEQLRYVLGHLDEDNLSDGLKSKIESGGMGSEVLQTLDAITLRVSGQDDAMSELRVGLSGITATVQEQGGAITQLEQTAQGLTSTVQANKELSEQQAAAALETARKYTDTQLEGYPTNAEMSSAIEQRAESITSTVAAVYSTRDELQSTVEQRAEGLLSEVSARYGTKEEMHTEIEQLASGLRLEASSEGLADVFASSIWDASNTKSETFNVSGKWSTCSADAAVAKDIIGQKLNVSFECRVDAKITTASACGALIVIQYASGNVAQWLQYYSGTYEAQEAFVKVNKSYDLKDERPTGIYIQSHLEGSGSFTIRNIVGMVQAAGETASSTLTLLSGETELSSASIVLKGAVTFRNLRTLGETVINGSNITTGEISANLIKSGIMQSKDGTTVYDLTNGTIQMGASSGTRVLITRDTIRWYDGNDPTGIFYSKRGYSYIGANSDYTYYGWLPRDSMTGDYYGVRIQNNGFAHFNTSKLECGGDKNGGAGDIEADELIGNYLTIKVGGKGAAVPTKEYGVLRLISAESPIPQFFDNGSGVLDKTGKCWLFLRDEFLSTVSCSVVPQWHVTAAASVTVRKEGLCAVVEGAPGTAFDWLCIMPQIGCESMYCEPSDYDWANSMDRRDDTAGEELNGIERFEQSLSDEVLSISRENDFIEETWPEQLERSAS